MPPPMSEREYVLEDGWILGVRAFEDKLLIVGNELIAVY